ncbi:MAG: electron transfer flavoprotein subunit alpha/FixB family protein [Chloroflexota bacterium]
MSKVLVLAEHRRGLLQDITWEMLTKGSELAASLGAELAVLLLGRGVRNLAEALAKKATEVWLVEDERLASYNSEVYQSVLSRLLKEHKPVVTLVGHTSFGMDLAPRLAANLAVPLSTAGIDLRWEDGRLKTTRQMYNGKVNAEVSFIPASEYMVTVRPGSFPGEGATVSGEIKSLSLPLEEPKYTRFIEYVEAATEGVDITKADILVSVGQGIGDKKNIPVVAELADALGGVLSCSRPVVDKKWLPKGHQVGTSGKTVKPKLYIAVGISGAFQHLAGIKGGTIIAINKDPKAPIFRVADYGIVGNLFEVVPALKEKIKARKAG